MLHSRLKLFTAAIATLLLSSCATLNPGTDVHASSVKITNMAQNHGGTGIILRSSDQSSLVLTNSHVCGVVEQGGLVTGEAGSFLVTGYKKAESHDLCLIKVSGNLGASTKIANRPPELYYEAATISGHPSLYPNVITKGHFSGKDIITILTGVKPCTDADANDPDKALICAILGGIPVVKQYQSTLVTATIMPGSSGSGVYNSDGELSGVAFAGQGSLGYAWTVPYEYMKNFLEKEQYRIPFTRPPNEIDIFAKSGGEKRSVEAYMERLKKVCATGSREKLKDLCSMADIDILK